MPVPIRKGGIGWNLRGEVKIPWTTPSKSAQDLDTDEGAGPFRKGPRKAEKTGDPRFFVIFFIP
jgi:hypothetical protein